MMYARYTWNVALTADGKTIHLVLGHQKCVGLHELRLLQEMTILLNAALEPHDIAVNITSELVPHATDSAITHQRPGGDQ
jgi:hypothetical protein